MWITCSLMVANDTMGRLGPPHIMSVSCLKNTKLIQLCVTYNVNG